MGGRAVECGGLENRCGGNSTGGSNPSPSASILAYMPIQTKKPAVLRDFSCIDFGMGEIWGFFGTNIRHSIQCPFLLSQWYKKPPGRCPGIEFGIDFLGFLVLRKQYIYNCDWLAYYYPECQPEFINFYHAHFYAP